jgi:hypothetical protein
VSYYEISADGNAWRRLSSAATTHYTSRAYLICDAFETEAGAIPSGTVGLIISRTIDDGIHEDLDITNFGRTLVKFNLEVALRSDFADIFEVKSHRFVRRGRIATEWDQKGHTLRTSYANRDFERVFTYSLSDSGSPPVYANGRITFPILLESRASWHSCCEYTFGVQRRMRRRFAAAIACPGTPASKRSNANGWRRPHLSHRPTKMCTDSSGSQSRTSAR